MKKYRQTLPQYTNKNTTQNIKKMSNTDRNKGQEVSISCFI